jgi:Pyruvate/2-oxoacid:ferredoxin oxidoreductase delta subunit
MSETTVVEQHDPWMHRSIGMRCKTCMWFVPKMPVKQSTSNTYDLGRCRRHAPTMGGYPIVFVNDWCGDHRLDENMVS